MAILTSCSFNSMAHNEAKRVDSLSVYRIALNYMQNNALLPQEAKDSNGIVPVFVVEDLPCPNCGVPIENFIGYSEMKSLANSEQYSSYPKADTSPKCKDLLWPDMGRLSTTNRKRVALRFDQVDSFNFSPLRMVTCWICDNVSNREEFSWSEAFSETQYYVYAIILDPKDSVVKCYGGAMSD